MNKYSKASIAGQANEWVVQANEQTDELVAQYLCLDSWLFCALVHPKQILSTIQNFGSFVCGWSFDIDESNSPAN